MRKDTAESLKDIFEVVKDIKKKVSKKERVFRKHLPLRDPATGTVYEFLINQSKGKKDKTTSFYVFRIAITMLRHTGLRVSEIMEEVLLFRST